MPRPLMRWCSIVFAREPLHVTGTRVAPRRSCRICSRPSRRRGAEKVRPHKRSRTLSKGPATCTTERLGLRWCQGGPGIPWTFWQPSPASAQSSELEYRQLGLRGVFRDPAGPQHGEGGRTADGREGGYRGPRHPKILSMMTAGARDENAPWGGWRRKE